MDCSVSDKLVLLLMTVNGTSELNVRQETDHDFDRSLGGRMYVQKWTTVTNVEV